MTRYAREISAGNEIRLIDCVDAPGLLPFWAADDAEWLAKQFPTLTGWVQVASTNVAGATKQPDGSYLNPVVTAILLPKVMSKTEFNKFGWTKLGMATFQSILESVRANTGTSTAEKEARAVVQQYDSAQTLSKDEVSALGSKLAATGAAFMTEDQVAAMTGDNWPNEPA